MDNPQDMKPQRDVLEVQAGPQGPTLAEAAPAEPAQVDIASTSAHGPLTAQGSAPPPGESGAVTMHGEVLAPPRRSLKRFILPVLLITALGYGTVKFNDWFTEGRWTEAFERIEDNFPNDPAGLCLLRFMNRTNLTPPDNWDGSFAPSVADTET